MTTTTPKPPIQDPCPGCCGSGVQQNFEGLRVICPVCGGSGYWVRPTPGGSLPEITCQSDEWKAIVRNRQYAEIGPFGGSIDLMPPQEFRINCQ